MRLLDAEVMRLAAWQVFRTKKFLFACLVTLIPLGAGILTILVDADQEGTAGWTFDADLGAGLLMVVLRAGVPLTALLLAGGLFADEMEDRTLTYLLVRPIKRRTLYLSKWAVTALVAAGLAALQALLFGLCRLASWVSFGQGSESTYYDGVLERAIPNGAILAAGIPLGILTAALLAAALTGIFGFVTLVTPRFHFFANLIVYLAWELPFSMFAGPGLLTVSYHAAWVMSIADPTIGQAPDAWYPAWSGPIVVALAVAGWAWAGAKRAETRDFNVTSAAS